MSLFGKPADYLESSDSSSVCMRASAEALRGKHFRLRRGVLERAVAELAGCLGPGVSQGLVEVAVSLSATDPGRSDEVRTEALARRAISHYDGLEGPYPAVLMGAPGGGVSHLASVLGVPFLSEHFLISFRDETAPDDVETYQSHGARWGRTILRHNPDLSVINHYDPLHDRFLIRHLNHVRMKLLQVPDAYRSFLRRRLTPDGTILFVDCRYRWRQYRIGKRHTFQVGGLGGISDRTFLEGNPDIEALKGDGGSRESGGWSLDRPLEEAPESEWGTLPAFRQAVAAFADREGYEFRVLEGDSPNDFSRLAFRAYERLYERCGLTPRATLIDCFTQTDPYACLQARLVPLWLPFNGGHSLEFLRRMKDSIPGDRPVLFGPLPNFSPALDTVSLSRWTEVLADHDVTLIGVDPKRYPADLPGLYRFPRELGRWCADRADPVADRLAPDELLGVQEECWQA